MLRRDTTSDENWDHIKNLMPGKEGGPAVTAKDFRLSTPLGVRRDCLKKLLVNA